MGNDISNPNHKDIVRSSKDIPKLHPSNKIPNRRCYITINILLEQILTAYYERIEIITTRCSQQKPYFSLFEFEIIGDKCYLMNPILKSSEFTEYVKSMFDLHLNNCKFIFNNTSYELLGKSQINKLLVINFMMENPNKIIDFRLSITKYLEKKIFISFEKKISNNVKKINDFFVYSDINDEPWYQIPIFSFEKYMVVPHLTITKIDDIRDANRKLYRDLVIFDEHEKLVPDVLDIINDYVAININKYLEKKYYKNGLRRRGIKPFCNIILGKDTGLISISIK